MNCQTLNLVRTLIPYVIPLIDNIEDFPEAYCDVTTAQILSDRNQLWQIMGSYNARPRCGKVEGKGHIWVQFGETNIDFTAHQFNSLRRYVSTVDGYKVLVGSDTQLESIGYTFHGNDQCAQQLMDANYSLMIEEFGDLNPTSVHWCRQP